MKNTEQWKSKLNNKIENELKQAIQDYTGKIYIGYSGGVDSHALLFAITNLLPKEKIAAIHVNHNMQDESGSWANHCKETCDNIGIKLIIKSVNIKQDGDSPEDAARKIRYKAFFEEVEEQGLLLLSHHQDDQIETIIHRLCRGTGVRGLSGIKPRTYNKNRLIIRPFLNISKSEILDYAKNNNLVWIEDHSNNDTSYDRNYIRNEIIPNLKRRWPAVAQNISRTAKHCANSILFQDEYINTYENEIINDNSLNIMKLILIDDYLQKIIVRKYIMNNIGMTPTEKQLKIIFKEIINSKNKSGPKLIISQYIIRKFKNNIIIEYNQKDKELKEFEWNKELEQIQIPNSNKKLKKINIEKNSILNNNLTVKFRSGGERIHQVGRQNSQLLKKLFQEWEIPPWKRNKIPLIFYKNELILIPGLAKSEKYFKDNQENIIISK
jgi:tRNA(Ile)-lysidine synthase